MNIVHYLVNCSNRKVEDIHITLHRLGTAKSAIIEIIPIFLFITPYLAHLDIWLKINIYNIYTYYGFLLSK